MMKVFCQAFFQKSGGGLLVAKEKIKTIYVCTSCGAVSGKWLGRCSACGEWDTMMEDAVKEPSGKGLLSAQSARANTITKNVQTKATPLSNIGVHDVESRILTNINELDRVLGGGVVIGSVVLIGGEPGAGKSTLLLQMCGEVSKNKKVLYVTGEESARQIKLRANRIGVQGDNLDVAVETDVDVICELITQTKPALVVIDSIQTVRCEELSSSAGSVSQVKESAARLQNIAKSNEIPTFIVGHVNKDGAIAGPKVMEHIVDTVLYFEGDKTLPYRVLRAVKNRYGSTNEIGMFDMVHSGLKEITNPSGLLLDGRPLGISGNCVACTMEGMRPVLSEVQALVTKSGFGTPRRASSGFDYNRMNLIIAVLEKRAGYFLGTLDVYINIVGGLELDETACDLSVCMAIVSALTDKPVPDDMIVFGEIGLGGEVRNVTNAEYRIREAQRMGFTQAILPKQSMDKLDKNEFDNIELIGVSNVSQAIGLM